MKSWWNLSNNQSHPEKKRPVVGPLLLGLFENSPLENWYIMKKKCMFELGIWENIWIHIWQLHSWWFFALNINLFFGDILDSFSFSRGPFCFQGLISRIILLLFKSIRRFYQIPYGLSFFFCLGGQFLVLTLSYCKTS